MPGRVFHLITDYAVECRESQCPDRTLYVALHALSKKEPLQRTWDAFTLEKRSKVHVNSQFYLDASRLISRRLFGGELQVQQSGENAHAAKRKKARNDEVQKVDTGDLPEEYYKLLRPQFVLVNEAGNFDLGLIQIQGITLPEIIFNFMQALQALPLNTLTLVSKYRAEYALQFLMNVETLTFDNERFCVGIDFDVVRRDLTVSLANWIMLIHHIKAHAGSEQTAQKTLKLHLHKQIYEDARILLSFFYNIKLFLEILNCHARLARALHSQDAKLNLTLINRHHDQIEVRAFLNKWCRVENGKFVTTLRKEHINRFKIRYLNHSSEEIRELASACLQMCQRQQTYKKYLHVGVQLKRIRENIKEKDFHTCVETYTPSLTRELTHLLYFDTAVLHSLRQIEKREKILTVPIPWLRSVEFLYSFYHSIFSVIQSCFEQASGRKRAVKQTHSVQFMSHVEMPSPSLFAQSLLLNPQHGFLEEEKEEANEGPVISATTGQASAATVSHVSAAAEVVEEADDVVVLTPVSDPNALEDPSVSSFTYKTLKSILRVKDNDIRGDFLYHDRVCAWFEQLDKTGKRWEEVGNMDIRVHAFPLALDKYVGTLFSERGEWVDPTTNESQVQYKLPIEVTQGGKTARYVLRYTRNKKGVWYHRDMTLQDHHLWNNVDFPPLSREALNVQSKSQHLQIKTRAKTEVFDPVTETVTIDFSTVKITLFRVR